MFAVTLRGNALVASFSIFVLSNWSLLGFAVSIGALAGSFVAHCTLLQRRVRGDSPVPPLNLERDINKVTIRTIIALSIAVGVQTILFGFTSGDVFSTIFLGVTKALSWYFTIRTVSHCL